MNDKLKYSMLIGAGAALASLPVRALPLRRSTRCCGNAIR